MPLEHKKCLEDAYDAYFLPAKTEPCLLRTCSSVGIFSTILCIWPESELLFAKGKYCSTSGVLSGLPFQGTPDTKLKRPTKRVLKTATARASCASCASSVSAISSKLHTTLLPSTEPRGLRVMRQELQDDPCLIRCEATTSQSSVWSFCVTTQVVRAQG